MARRNSPTSSRPASPSSSSCHRGWCERRTTSPCVTRPCGSSGASSRDRRSTRVLRRRMQKISRVRFPSTKPTTPARPSPWRSRMPGKPGRRGAPLVTPGSPPQSRAGAQRPFSAGSVEAIPRRRQRRRGLPAEAGHGVQVEGSALDLPGLTMEAMERSTYAHVRRSRSLTTTILPPPGAQRSAPAHRQSKGGRASRRRRRSVATLGWRWATRGCSGCDAPPTPPTMTFGTGNGRERSHLRHHTRRAAGDARAPRARCLGEFCERPLRRYRVAGVRP